MNQSLLKKNLKQIQNDYLILLESIKSQIDSDTEDLINIIDEIALFWKSNEAFVDIYLSTITKLKCSYFITGVSYLDVLDNEHYPFVSLGDVHIVDDPTVKHLRVIEDIEDTEFLEQIKGQLKLAISDNIKILKDYSEVIQIMPISFIGMEGIKDLFSQNEVAFLSLFKDDKLSIKQFFNECSTIEDVSIILKDEAKEKIHFKEYEDMGKSFAERFYDFVNETPFPIEIKNDAKKFHFIINGYITQTLDIFLISKTYSLIPYLRFELAFNYWILFSGSAWRDEKFREIIKKSIIAYLFYIDFDKDIANYYNFSEYYELIQSSKLSENIFKELESLDFVSAGINETRDKINTIYKNLILAKWNFD